MFDDNNVEVVEQQEKGQVCAKNEHFINPPMFCFYNNFPEHHGQVTQGVPEDKGVRIRLQLCAPCNPQSLHGFNQELP